MKKYINWLCKILAKYYLRFKKIEVIAITGSAGKTTAKAAIAHLLSDIPGFYVPEVGYNTEIGLPLNVFQLENPTNPRSLASWIGLILRMKLKFFLREPYQTIVLEYGADKPGDIDYLKSIAEPHVAIVTTVLPTHMAGFGSIEAIAKEKGSLVANLTEDDFAILNNDNEYTKEMGKNTRAHVVSIGEAEGSELRYANLKFGREGMSFDLFWKDEKASVNMQLVAPQLLPSILSAIAVALIYGSDITSLAHKLSDFEAENGRMRLYKGIKGITIIDDSYNSNPESAIAALNVLGKFDGRRVAVLGSMNELGDYEKEAHEKVAKAALENADMVITIGEVAGRYIYPVVSKSLPANASAKFDNPYSAGEYLLNSVKSNEVILFKGSQNGVFAEEAIKYLLSDPDSAADLLVRQTKMWENKKKEYRRKVGK